MEKTAADPDQNDRNEKFQHMEYFNFMISELNNMIRYSDSKHTLGMTLVVSIMVASTQFLLPKLDSSVFEVRLVLNLHIASALLAVAFGYVGIFPQFISPSPSPSSRRKSRKTPNIFYFKEISASDIETLRETVDTTFPHSTLSENYRHHASVELYALSRIVAGKFLTFRLFLYALFILLVTLGWLLITTFIDLSGHRG